MNTQKTNEKHPREPVGSETIACFATVPMRCEVPYTVRQIVYAAIAAAKAKAVHRR